MFTHRIGATFVLGLIGLAALLPAQPVSKVPLSLEQLSEGFETLARQTAPAVVQVLSSGYGPLRGGDPLASVQAKQRGGGSGVIVDPEGYIVTNAHVIEGARRVEVVLPVSAGNDSRWRSILKPRGRLQQATIIGLDRETDLAVLKIDASGLPYLRLSDSEALRQGQIVFAFGSPLGLENSVTMGVVSSVARQLEPDDTMIYIQTDTAINPGNSGGPLLNAAGEVVGINTLIFSQSGGYEGLGFAAPSNIVRAVYEQIRKHGSVRRGEIGVNAQTITPLLAQGLGLPRDWGVVLADVYPGGPAAIAGLEVGDLVLAVDGKAMENARQFLVNVYQRSIGDVARLEVLRAGEKRTIPVAVLERSDDPERFATLVTREQHLIEALGLLGISLDRRLGEMLPRLRHSAGVVVAARVAQGPYWNAQFEPGDVIYRVNRTPTPDLPALRKALEDLSEGDAVVAQLERQGRMVFVSFQIE
jgi:serine protease Do